MSCPSDPPPDRNLAAQIAGVYVAQDQANRAARLAELLQVLERVYREASAELSKVRDFVDVPGGILGNVRTKHGEIAEHVEVGVRNARDLMNRAVPTARIDGVPRTGPTDYVVAGEDIQSKFINGSNNTLRHVLDHIEKYPGFPKTGAYHIPKDQHAQMLRVLNGTESELSETSQRALVSNVRKIELATGRPFADSVRPSVSSYGDVQQGKIHETLNERQSDVDKSRADQEAGHRADAGPSLNGAAGAAVVGAAVGAGLRLAGGIFRKVRAGKNPFRGEFDQEDWNEIGVQAAEGGLTGAVSATGIYLLTNYADMAAPFAGAFVSSTLAVKDLYVRYRRNELDFQEFVELGQLACAEGALVGLATALGQAAIPVPILGALVGAAAGKLLSAAATGLLEKDADRLGGRLAAMHEAQLSQLDESLRSELSRLCSAYDRLGDLTQAAFDLRQNMALRLIASVNLAREHGVGDDDIIHSVNELDSYMLE